MYISLILSIMGPQGWAWSTLFPIHAPRYHISVPSLVILMVFGSGWSSECSWHAEITLLQCSWVLIRIILVFSTSNFAPEAWHHWVRIRVRELYLSVSDRYTVVSSVYRLTLTLVRSQYWEAIELG